MPLEFVARNGLIALNNSVITGSLNVTRGITGSLQGTASWANNAVLLNNTASSVFATTGSNIFRGNQTVTGSLFTTGSNTLIGTTTLTGSLNITGSTTQIGSNTLLGNTTLSGSIIISGSFGSVPTVKIYGDTQHNGYIRFDPVSTNIDTSISASYIYVSGSTNDLYFSQNSAGYANTTRLRWLEGNLYTGLLNGGIISASIGTNTYTISSGSGIVVNLNASYNNNPYPTVQYVNWGNLTGTIDALSASYDQQFVAVLSDGTIGAQGIPYSDGDYNTKIPIGIVLHQNRSTINAAQTFPSVAYGWKQRSFDFIKAFGPLKIAGYILTPSGSSTRGLVLSGGTAWVDGRNYTVDPNNPSYIVEVSGITTSKIFRYRQSGSGWVYDTNGGVGYTDIDPTQYSNNGILTPVASNDWSIQRVFYFPNSATKALYVYYGNATYSNEAAALAAVSTETFNEAPNTAANAIYVGYILVRNDADFTVPASYTIYEASLFRAGGSSVGAGGGGGGSTTLASLTDVSLLSPTNGQALIYNSVTTKWENKSYISASISGNALSASYAETASYWSGSVINALSASFASTASFWSGSIINVLSASYADTASYWSGSIINALSSSYAETASYWSGSIINSLSSSFASTASSADNFTVRGTLTAQTIIVQTITSSIDFVTGSTRFGSDLTNTHQFTGSVSVTGSLDVNGSNVVLTNQTSSMSVATASYWSGSIINALSASFASTASFWSGSITNALSSSFASTASFWSGSIINALSSSFASTASFWSGSITNALSSSFASTASFWSGSITNALSASFASTASFWSGSVTNALSASFASTASFINPLNQNVVITGSLTVSGAMLNIASASFDYNQNLNVATGSFQVIASEATGSYRAAFFDYVAFNGLNARAGTVFSVWNTSSVEWSETFTSDVGTSTSAITLQAALSGGFIQLQATASAVSWSIRSLVRML